jgi:hypothetical protein
VCECRRHCCLCSRALTLTPLSPFAAGPPQRERRGRGRRRLARRRWHCVARVGDGRLRLRKLLRAAALWLHEHPDARHRQGAAEARVEGGALCRSLWRAPAGVISRAHARVPWGVLFPWLSQALDLLLAPQRNEITAVTRAKEVYHSTKVSGARVAVAASVVASGPTSALRCACRGVSRAPRQR